MFRQLTVIGLGKMGCSLALYYAKSGIKIVGLDVNQTTVDNLNNGVSHLTLPDSDKVLREVLDNKTFEATVDAEYAISTADAIIVIVPLVVDDKYNIDYSIIDSVAVNIGKYIKKGTLVAFETSLPTGTTRNRLKKIILDNSSLGKKDFFVGFSPERVSTNTVFRDLEIYPKIIGGVDSESNKKMEELYTQILPKSKIINLQNSDAAEFTKLMGMIYRDVNIALSNEFAKFAEKAGLDIDEIIQACNTNPFAHVLSPGIGAGGHCLPVYPHFFIKNSKDLGLDPRIAEEARKINNSMPKFSIKKLNSFEELKNKKVLILGLGYREDIKETFLSPTLDLIKELKQFDSTVYIDDYLFSSEEISKYGAVKYDIFSQDEDFDAVIISTYHSKYSNFDFTKLKTKIILDGRNKLDKKLIESSGIKYLGIGK
ncbi:nucleotide sugar dehydrogenase [Candidatus Woesearchaeota archaeon]|nr:nucleotide sugar dehydrogenase [Candidatus Woesearchaeota archaeon]